MDQLNAQLHGLFTQLGNMMTHRDDVDAAIAETKSKIAQVRGLISMHPDCPKPPIAPTSAKKR